MDVWIVISTTIGTVLFGFLFLFPIGEPRAVHEQLLWISDKLGHVHSDRVIISKDKTLLKADFLIDPQPFPEKNTIKFFASRRESPKGEVVEVCSSFFWKRVPPYIFVFFWLVFLRNIFFHNIFSLLENSFLESHFI